MEVKDYERMLCMLISVTCEHNSDFTYHVIWDGRQGEGLPGYPPTRGHEKELDLLCQTFWVYNMIIENTQKTIEKLENVLYEYFDKGIIAGQLACFPDPPPLRNPNRENCDYLDLLDEKGNISEQNLKILDSKIENL